MITAVCKLAHNRLFHCCITYFDWKLSDCEYTNSDNRISDYKLANKYLLSKGQLLHRIGVFPFCTILRLKIEKGGRKPNIYLYKFLCHTYTDTHQKGLCCSLRPCSCCTATLRRECLFLLCLI